MEASGSNPFVVFNCNYNGLSIMQELGRCGVSGFAVDSQRSIGTFSRYATFRRVPDPSDDEEGFVSALLKLCNSQKNRPVLFPTNDEWAAAIARHRDRLLEVALPVVASWEAVRTLLDKSEFYRIGEYNEYMTPRTWEAVDYEQVPEEEYPLVIKPKWRRMASEWGGQYKQSELDDVRLIPVWNRSDAEEVVNRYERIAEHLLLQTYVPGKCDQMYTVGVYADAQSKVRALFVGRKVRGYPSDYGDTAVGESSKLPDELLALVKRCVEELRLEGILEFEFKYDEQRDRYWLIEINPRSWSWVGATPFCGVSLPWIAYQDRVGNGLDEKIYRQQSEAGDLRYVFVHKDLPNVLVRYRDDEPRWAMGPRAWLRDHHQAERIVWADLQWDDPWPAFRSMVRTGKELAKGVRDVFS